MVSVATIVGRDIRSLVASLAQVVGAISLGIVVLAISSLLTLAAAGRSADGLNIFSQLMAMNWPSYEIHAQNSIVLSTLNIVFSFANWVVLIGGAAWLLASFLTSYSASVKARARFAPSRRTGANSPRHAASNTDRQDGFSNFKQAGNS